MDDRILKFLVDKYNIKFYRVTKFHYVIRFDHLRVDDILCKLVVPLKADTVERDTIDPELIIVKGTYLIDNEEIVMQIMWDFVKEVDGLILGDESISVFQIVEYGEYRDKVWQCMRCDSEPGFENTVYHDTSFIQGYGQTLKPISKYPVGTKFTTTLSIPVTEGV